MNYFTYNKDGQVVRRMVKPGVYAYYDTVIYLSNDHIVMEEMTTDPNYQSHLWKRELFLELGMVKWKVYYIPDNGGVRQDTVEYIYDAGGKLARRWDHSEVGLMSELTYDVNRNLEKVTSYFKNNRTGEIYPSKWEETFTGYDKVANPLRGSALWDDFLYRSLSGNNFAGYQYGLNGGVQGSFTWQLQYKANGQIDYSR
jgi:hypothetical protein